MNEQALRVTCKDSASNFDELLTKSILVSFDQRNLQQLLAEIHKTINNLNPMFMAELFVTKDVSFNLCGSTALHKATTSLYGIDTIQQKIMVDSTKRI